jgi:endonuclease/exonuclease/phosphatase (EEP) superfamily protein YafD
MFRKKKYYSNAPRRRKKKRSWLLEILVLVFAVLLVCCAYAGRFDPRSFIGAPFLTLAFMPMLCLSLVVLLIAILKRRWLAVFTIVIAGVVILPIFRYYIPLNDSDSRPPMPVDTSLMLKVMTYNALAFNYNEPELGGKPSESMRLILDNAPDVVLLQEGCPSRAEWDDIPSIAPYKAEMEKKYPYIYQGSEGLGIMSRFPFTVQSLGEERHSRSPLGYNRNQNSYLARAFDLQLPSGKQLRLVDFRLQSYHLSFGKSDNVRTSPDVKPSALERMRRAFTLRHDDAMALRAEIDNSPETVIVCGDLNDVPSSNVYRLIKGNDLTDAWVEVGYGYAHTFNRHHLPYRIDHVFYRGRLQALQAERIKGGSSDHYPIMVTFDIDVNY